MYAVFIFLRNIGFILLIFLLLLETGISDELSEAIVDGKKEYMRSCAICHGEDGKGDGVYTSKLVVKPSNLTVLQKANKGVFPLSDIFQTIEGSDNVKLHGPRAMPIWGDRFNYESSLYVDPRFNRTFVRGRIFELVLYLKDIQIK